MIRAKAVATLVALLAGVAAGKDGRAADPASEAPWPYSPWQIVATLTTDGQGRLLSCTKSMTGQAPGGMGDPCEVFGHESQAFYIGMRGGVGGPPRPTLITIVSTPGEAAPAIPTRAGASASQLRLTIDPSGAVTDCRQLSASGLLTMLPSMCVINPGPFVPVSKGSAPTARVAMFSLSIVPEQAPE